MSYFDEGVFGNHGWGEPGGPGPLGRSGLPRWSGDGVLEYEFSPPDVSSAIADCYALSVIGEDAWTCYYTDFPSRRGQSQRLDSRMD